MVIKNLFVSAQVSDFTHRILVFYLTARNDCFMEHTLPFGMIITENKSEVEG